MKLKNWIVGSVVAVTAVATMGIAYKEFVTYENEQGDRKAQLWFYEGQWPQSDVDERLTALKQNIPACRDDFEQKYAVVTSLRYSDEAKKIDIDENPEIAEMKRDQVKRIYADAKQYITSKGCAPVLADLAKTATEMDGMIADSVRDPEGGPDMPHEAGTQTSGLPLLKNDDVRQDDPTGKVMAATVPAAGPAITATKTSEDDKADAFKQFEGYVRPEDIQTYTGSIKKNFPECRDAESVRYAANVLAELDFHEAAAKNKELTLEQMQRNLNRTVELSEDQPKFLDLKNCIDLYTKIYDIGKDNADVIRNAIMAGDYPSEKPAPVAGQVSRDQMAEYYNGYIIIKAIHDARSDHLVVYVSDDRLEAAKEDMKYIESVFKQQHPDINVDDLWNEASSQSGQSVDMIVNLGGSGYSQKMQDMATTLLYSLRMDAEALKAARNEQKPIKKDF